MLTCIGSSAATNAPQSRQVPEHAVSGVALLKRMALGGGIREGMTISGLLAILSITIPMALATSWLDARPTPKPNIILILSDDMGYSDIGCYGGEIETPNLDRLAANGLRYTRFYNTGRCCPTRASLLTGLYAHQAGKWPLTARLMPGGDKMKWPLQRGFDRFYGSIIGVGSFFDPWTLTRGNEAITPDNDGEYQPEKVRELWEKEAEHTFVYPKRWSKMKHRHRQLPFF